MVFLRRVVEDRVKDLRANAPSPRNAIDTSAVRARVWSIRCVRETHLSRGASAYLMQTPRKSRGVREPVR